MSRTLKRTVVPTVMRPTSDSGGNNENDISRQSFSACSSSSISATSMTKRNVAGIFGSLGLCATTDDREAEPSNAHKRAKNRSFGVLGQRVLDGRALRQQFGRHVRRADRVVARRKLVAVEAERADPLKQKLSEKTNCVTTTGKKNIISR
jgi:hypothetical protein